MSEKKRPVPLPVGLSTLVLIFLSLCLLTFSALSFLNARADLRLARKTAAHTRAYYAASEEAARRLTELNGQLQSLAAESEDSEDFFRLLTAEAEGFEAETGTLTFSVPVSDSQELLVRLSLCWPEPGQSFYSITEWRTVNTSDWKANTELRLFIQSEQEIENSHE